MQKWANLVDLNMLQNECSLVKIGFDRAEPSEVSKKRGVVDGSGTGAFLSGLRRCGELAELPRLPLERQRAEEVYSGSGRAR